jgi:hypothetical protein
VAQAVLALLLALSLVMLTRRTAGAFVQPLGGLALVATACGLAIAAALARFSWLRRIANSGQPNPLAFALPGIAVILWLTALSLPGTPALAIASAWFVAIAGEGSSWLIAYRPQLLNRGLPQRIVAEKLVSAEDNAADAEAEIPAGLVQQITRVHERNGEAIHALAEAVTPAGDRLAVVHLAFCPPLAAKPELTAHAVDTDDAEVRITQAEAFGVRIEVRLPQPAAEPRSVLVEVLGSVTSPRCD